MVADRPNTHVPTEIQERTPSELEQSNSPISDGRERGSRGKITPDKSKGQHENAATISAVMSENHIG